MTKNLVTLPLKFWKIPSYLTPTVRLYVSVRHSFCSVLLNFKNQYTEYSIMHTLHSVQLNLNFNNSFKITVCKGFKKMMTLDCGA